jgi:ATP adenylyltransferase
MINVRYIILPQIIIYFTISLGMEHENSILYSPWRSSYTSSTQSTTTQLTTTLPHKKPCVFCTQMQAKNDEKYYILFRGDHNYISLANPPYINNGMHFLIIPYTHKKEPNDLSYESLTELNALTKQLSLRFSNQCNEINIGINMGSCAAASIPDHLHKHMVINTTPYCDNLIQAIEITKQELNLQSLFQSLKPTLSTLKTAYFLKNNPKNVSTYQKNCYLCSVIQQNTDQKNLIIYRGIHTAIMLNHHPKHVGHISIVPTTHIESAEEISDEAYQELNSLTTHIYPILLKTVQCPDATFAMTLYGSNSESKKHTQLHIIPRKNKQDGFIIVGSDKIMVEGKIEELYKKLTADFVKKNEK